VVEEAPKRKYVLGLGVREARWRMHGRKRACELMDVPHVWEKAGD
jgi:hypothetical protein